MSMIEKVMYADNLDENIKEIILVDGTKIVNREHKKEIENKDNK